MTIKRIISTVKKWVISWIGISVVLVNVLGCARAPELTQ